MLALVGHRPWFILQKKCSTTLKNSQSAQQATFWLAPSFKPALKGDISLQCLVSGLFVLDGFYRWCIVWRAVTDPEQCVLPQVSIGPLANESMFQVGFSPPEGVCVSSGLMGDGRTTHTSKSKTENTSWPLNVMKLPFLSVFHVGMQRKIRTQF